jgi:hypothetical protein
MVTDSAILRALLVGAPRTTDATGRIRVMITVDGVGLVAVIAPDDRVVVTIWPKER